MKNQPVADVCIVGGGPVGLLLANLLLAKRMTVILLEKNANAFLPSATYLSRVSALNQRSVNLLKKTGCWSGIQATACAYQHMRIWEDQFAEALALDADTLFEVDLGHIVYNQQVQYALWERLQAETFSEQLQVIIGEAPASLQKQASSWLLQTDAGNSYQAQVIVGADGCHSWVRAQLGIDTQGKSYQQQALVTNLRLEGFHQKTAWQRFFKTGPVALLPLADPKEVSLVWTTTPAEACQLLAQKETAFLASLNTVFAGSPVPKITTLLQPLQAFPLSWQHAQTYVVAGGVLVGDAAHHIHPLAGQGLNLGFADAKVLAEVLAEAKMKQRPLGTLAVLRRYENQRRLANAGTLHLMTLLNRCYQWSAFPVKGLRHLGVRFVNRSRLVKSFLVDCAQGQFKW